MKNSFIGSLVGIAIVIALDLFARVIISIYMGEEILMFSYTQFPGLLWPVVLTIIGGFTAFFGSMFSLTYGRTHRLATLSTFLILIILLRYGQIYLLTGKESLFYPITTLVLSLGGLVIAWQLTGKTKEQSELYDRDVFDQQHDHHQTKM